ncbi:hypothetical protein V2J09_023740 [Rumex salicifolius]
MEFNKLFLMLLMIAINVISGGCDLQVGFYSRTCPNAEATVRSVVGQAVNSDPTMAAALLRMHFHDCFVEGCDGSILINRNLNDDEMKAFGHQGLRGFDVLEAAKAQLESVCPGVVSCSDIVALAARDAVAMSSGPQYEVLTGRRDGLVSNKSLAAEMPDVDEPIDLLKAKFARKGLTAKDLVLLSAAHTIGSTACFFMPRRLYNFSGRGDSDASLNPFFLQQLMQRCPPNGNVNIRLPLDAVTNMRFDDQILRNVRQGIAVIASDARLDDDPETRAWINSYILFAIDGRFFRDFSQAMVKMGTIGVKTSPTEGEIRRVCSSFN